MAKRMTISARRARRTKTVAGRRVARPGEAKPAAKRKSAKPASESKRAPTARPAKVAITPSTALHFERVTGKVTLTPPPGYMLSVLLKLVDRAEKRIYAWWAAAGRYGLDAASVTFNVNGADVIRCDVPNNFDFTTTQLEDGLVTFCKTDEQEKTKLIGGGDGTVNGPGGTGKVW